MSAHLRLVKPRNKNRTVPVRPANAELRTREYLTPKEVEKLIEAARDGRYGQRDTTLILVAFRHGLRASELCDLEWSQVEWGRNDLCERTPSRPDQHWGPLPKHPGRFRPRAPSGRHLSGQPVPRRVG